MEKAILVLCFEGFVRVVILEIEPVAGRLLEIILSEIGGYLSEGGLISGNSFLALFVEMEIVHLLGIASLLVPVTHECLGPKLTVEI
jgi:hypothetical protein